MSSRITTEQTKKYQATIRYYAKEEEYVLKITEIATSKLVVEKAFTYLGDAIAASSSILTALETIDQYTEN